MDLFCLRDDENYDRMCGHILFTSKGRLAYYCIFCGQYRNYENFITHLMENCKHQIDDDLRVYITKSGLTGLKTKSNSKNLPNKPNLEQTRCSEGNGPSSSKDRSQTKVTIQRNELLIQPDKLIQNECIKCENLPSIADTNSSNSNDIIVGEENDVNECLNPDPIQLEYCEDNLEEYINVEYVDEEEIDYGNQTNYQVNDDELVKDINSISYGVELEQDDMQTTDEDTLNSYQLEQIEEEIAVNIQLGEDIENKAFEQTSEINKSNNEIKKTTTTLKSMNDLVDVPFVVRNVRERKKYLPSHIAPEERKYKCPVCEKAFKDRPNMNYHLRRHTNMKSYSCPDCDKKFFTSSEVRLHSRVHKKPDKTFLCTVCGLAFETNYLFLEHQKRHTNQRDYVCKICEKGFFSLGTLKKHMSSHSTERPYPCEICSATFKTSGGLKSHMKQHENKREFKCQLCTASFNIQAGLYYHLSKHKKQDEIKE